MGVKICWCCQINVAWAEYDGKDYLGDEGEKPCFDCIEEMSEADDKTLDYE